MAFVPLSRAAGNPRNDAFGVWVWTKSNRRRRRTCQSRTKAPKSDGANSRWMGTTSTATSSGGSSRASPLTTLQEISVSERSWLANNNLAVIDVVTSRQPRNLTETPVC